MSSFWDAFDILFVDLDGTLLDARDQQGHHVISPRNLQAIERLQQANKLVVFSTGRLGANVRDILSLVNARHAVLGNGAEVWLDGRVVRRLEISVQQVLQLYNFIRAHKFMFKLDDDYKAYGAFSWRQQQMARLFNFVPQASYDFEMHLPRLKIVVWGHVAFNANRLVRKLKAAVPGLTIVTSNHGWSIEVTAAGATKGLGDEFVSQALKVARERTVHIGDMMNDATVVGHVGKLIAMKNADRHLLAMADYVGPHFRRAGFAKLAETSFEPRPKKKSRFA